MIKKNVGLSDVSREWVFRVVGGETQCMKVGDKVKPIKLVGGVWQIGHNYRASLPFIKIDDETFECVSSLNGKLMARIKRIK